MSSPPTPLKIGVLIFPGFQLLDYAGPLDAFNILALSHPLTLCTISTTLSPIPTHNNLQTLTGSSISQSIVPTHTLDTAPGDLDVLLIPGGIGARDEENSGVLGEIVGWLRQRGVGVVGGTGPRWVLTVCTGSEILARTGVLDGRGATTNKRAFNDVCSPFFPFLSIFSFPIRLVMSLMSLDWVEEWILTDTPNRSKLNIQTSNGLPKRDGWLTPTYGRVLALALGLIWRLRG
ncbi:class I glutamine amidotransferase-like protein [Plenodomus tracheiphilus IPT5]|uniref:Class I glutamine amidotransferase-like protein n=1 Tax=Plenodomus tracheiphilus IPT5 TaxID=1408161 RepID=A0A6A7B7J9_9PLEO|nr:class I glutamine amidotransferase-like protein [Plenodomus tracheiphilus IPT5]